MSRRPRNLAWVLAIGIVLVALALWRGGTRGPQVEQRSISPTVMGTTSRIVGVGPSDRLDAALNAALEELQSINRIASTYDSTSELSLFNRGPAGVDLRLPPTLMEVLRVSQDYWRRTDGAFDVTMRPLGRLWREAAEAGAPPDSAALAAVLGRVGFARLALGDSTARKDTEGLEVTLDAIVKGYAVDRALGALRRAGLSAGLVEVGGDLACYGRPTDAAAWQVGLQSPWEETALGVLALPGPGRGSIAVCTSGNYRRFVTIGGVRYSHIIDPRSGRPADTVPSVTVIAPDAMTADAWATSLSVLSAEEGFPLAEAADGVEALWILGGPDPVQMRWTSGFEPYWRR